MGRNMTKPTKMTVRPAKTPISLGIRPVWSESSLSALRKLGSLATHWAHSEDSDQTGRMPRLIWVFAGRKVTLLVLSCRGSFLLKKFVLTIHRHPYQPSRKKNELCSIYGGCPVTYVDNNDTNIRQSLHHIMLTVDWKASRLNDKRSFPFTSTTHFYTLLQICPVYTCTDSHST